MTDQAAKDERAESRVGYGFVVSLLSSVLAVFGAVLANIDLPLLGGVLGVIGLVGLLSGLALFFSGAASAFRRP